MKKSLISFIETLVAGVFVAVLIMLFVGQSLEISGDSMYPTLTNGERIMVEKVTYKGRPPARGDVIVFRSQSNNRIFIIKRVVAVAGDTIRLLSDSSVAVYKEPEGLVGSFGQSPSLGILNTYATKPIPKGYVVVLGDNRLESYDSRMFGPVPVKDVVGKALVVYWPLAKVRVISDAKLTY